MSEKAQSAGRKYRRVIWWKLGLGLILLPLAIIDFSPAGPAELKPQNSGETIGYYFGAIAILVAAIWLIVSGIRAICLRSD